MGCKCLEVVGAWQNPFLLRQPQSCRITQGEKTAAAISCIIRVCKPLSLVMSLRDLPMTSMDFDNSGHEILPSSYQEILASLRNRFGRPLYPRRRLRTNCSRFDLDEVGLQARHIAVRIGRGRPDKNVVHDPGQYHL